MNTQDVQKYEELANKKRLAKQIKYTTKILKYVDRQLKRGNDDIYISPRFNPVKFNMIEFAFNQIEQSLNNVGMTIHLDYVIQHGNQYHIQTKSRSKNDIDVRWVQKIK